MAPPPAPNESPHTSSCWEEEEMDASVRGSLCRRAHHLCHGQNGRGRITDKLITSPPN